MSEYRLRKWLLKQMVVRCQTFFEMIDHGEDSSRVDDTLTIELNMDTENA